MAIKLKLDGFDELLKNIEKAGGSMMQASEKCMKSSADIMHNMLISEMKSAGVDNDLVDRMPPPDIETDRNTCTANVGYHKGAYDPDNISDGYKVVFLNYGTPKRSKHGKIVAKGFIAKAKAKSQKKIKKLQEETLKEMLEDLS